jgi:hypothetical protein
MTLFSLPIIISDGPNIPAARNASCTWIISASGPITVTFFEFDRPRCDVTYSDCDRVEVYDGDLTANPRSAFLGPGAWGALAETGLPGERGLPPPITSTRGVLTIRFTTPQNLWYASNGFVARISSDSAPLYATLGGAVPATIGDLRCSDIVANMYAHFRPHTALRRRSVSGMGPSCRDLSGQRLKGTLPETLSQLTSLTAMCARTHPRAKRVLGNASAPAATCAGTCSPDSSRRSCSR